MKESCDPLPDRCGHRQICPHLPALGQAPQMLQPSHPRADFRSSGPLHHASCPASFGPWAMKPKDCPSAPPERSLQDRNRPAPGNTGFLLSEPETAAIARCRGGGGGIRTHGGVPPTPVFKTGAIDHSATPPTCGAAYAGRTDSESAARAISADRDRGQTALPFPLPPQASMLRERQRNVDKCGDQTAQA